MTDLPHSARLAYVGIDNRAVGAIAALLLGQWLGNRAGNVFTIISRGSFRGEEECEMGLRSEMRLTYPSTALGMIVDLGPRTMPRKERHRIVDPGKRAPFLSR